MTKESTTASMRALIESVQLREGRYWDNNGRYEKEANELQALVPSMGQAETQRGEIMRAGSKIYYDFYNNGFGNNWAAPLAFLDQNISLSPDVFDFLSQYAAGVVHGGRGDDAIIEKMLDEVVQGALKVDPDKPAAGDMWDTDTSRYDFPDEEEDDGWGYDDDEEEDDDLY